MAGGGGAGEPLNFNCFLLLFDRDGDAEGEDDPPKKSNIPPNIDPPFLALLQNDFEWLERSMDLETRQSNDAPLLITDEMLFAMMLCVMLRPPTAPLSRPPYDELELFIALCICIFPPRQRNRSCPCKGGGGGGG